MVRHADEQIIAKVLSMSEKELSDFMADLSPDVLDYLEIILSKAESNVPKLKRYLDR